MSLSGPVPGTFTRRDVRFASGEAYCSGWLYLPDGVERPPVIVLGHGLGAIREMRLDAFSERFAAAGFATLAFTYRYFGDSGGTPRQLMSVPRQLADWDAALDFIKTCAEVDGRRVAVWGTSFGGGHTITVASRHPELKAAISQCGLVTVLRRSPISLCHLGFKREWANATQI